jgi:hypothetical protein
VGLLDTILGRTKPVRANLDALFALPSAAVTLQSAVGVVATGNAGVCWKPPAGQPAQDVQTEIAQLLGIDDDDPGATSPPAATAAATAATAPPDPPAPGSGPLRQREDRFGFRWLLLDDPDLDTLVTRVHLVNSTLSDNGWGPQLLCSVFGFGPGPGSGSDVRHFSLVYLFKRGTFYPFAPDGKEHRDNELELRLRAVLGADLPVEPDLSRWFPLWELPVS